MTDPGRGDPAARRDDAEQRERLTGQIRLILAAIPGAAFFPPGDPAEAEYLYVEGRLLVRDADVARVIEVVGGEVARGGVKGLSAVEISGTTVPEALARLDDALGVGVATPDHIYYVTSKIGNCCPADEPTPADSTRPVPDFPRARSAGEGTVVTVIDTGLVSALTERHAWLAGVTGIEDKVDLDAIGPYGGHGTFSAGVLRSIAPRAEVHVDNLLQDAGAIDEATLLPALYRAMDRMPDVICMSAGAYTRSNIPPLAFLVFWEERLRHVKGTAFVVAAGNDSTREAFWPAAFDWTISVGALDADGRRAGFSNFGSWVDVYALGVGLVNAYPDGTYAYNEPPRAGQSATFPNAMASWSGTSFSTPLVAGMIAARASHTGQSGARAAQSLLRIARANAVAGVGAIADPFAANADDPAGSWSS